MRAERTPSNGRDALRVAVIGAGPAATAMHLPVLAQLRDKGLIELAVVCDLQSERASAARQRFGFKEESGDGAAVLERPDIHAVYLFGSAQLHHQYGWLALTHGKHLFVEKPIAPSHVEALELARAAASRNLIAVGGHNRRFYGAFSLARTRAGKTQWRFAEAVFHKPELNRPAPFGARTWLSANGIHALDALIFMMGGLPEHLSAHADHTGAFSALMLWPDGAQATFLCNNNAGTRREEYAFHGLGASYRIDEAQLAIEKDGKTETAAFPQFGDGITAEHEAFLSAIASGIEPPHAIAALAPSLFLCEQIERGFQGAIRLPEPAVARTRLSPTPVPASIAIAQPQTVQAALSLLPPQFKVVSLDEIERTGAPRPDVTAAVLSRGVRLTPEVLGKLPALKVVGVVGLSVAPYDPETLLARGIAIVNATDAYAESVAEFALALAILGRRRAFVSHELMRGGLWGTSAPNRGFAARIRRVAQKARPALRRFGAERLARKAWQAVTPGTGASRPLEPRLLTGATAGLIGWSANARSLTRRLRLEQVRVLVYSEHAAAEEIESAGAQRASLAEVLAADIVSLHRGLTPNTLHFLGAAELDQLRPGSVLINIARGALIEPSALIARLSKGDVFACLDTFETEPPARTDPLRTLPNVFLTSHIAGGSKDMQAAAAAEVVGKIVSYLNGEPAPSLSAKRLETMT